MGLIDTTDKAIRLLLGRRFTSDGITIGQESFTSTLDINSGEVYTDKNLIPTSSLPFSGSSQNGETHQSTLKYWYRHKLTKSNLDTDVWFFVSPPGSDSGITPQLINDNQEVNFISNKYAQSSLANANAEDATPGYNIIVYKSTSLDSGSLGGSAIVSTNDYQFDYKTGVLQFDANKPASNQYVYITAYQYVGRTLADEDFRNLFRLTGSSFNTTNDLEITGSLIVTQTLTASDVNIDDWNSVSSSLATLETDRISLQNSFNSYTSSTDLRLDSIEAATGSYLQASDLVSLNTFTGSANSRLASIEAATGSYVVNSQTGSFLVTGSVSANMITLEKADGSTFDLEVASSIFRQTGSVYATTNDIDVTGSLQVNFNESDQEFRISSQSITQFKVNNQGIAVFTSQSIEPVFVSGGMYYSSNGAFFLGTTD